jgi:hypothetical protein
MATRRISSEPRADYGAPERWQHSGRTLELTERAGLLAARALEEHLLDTLCVAQQITSVQREAGLSFLALFRAAGLEPRVTGSYNPVRLGCVFGAWDERSDEEDAAHARWQKLLRAMGPALSSVAIDVICFEARPTKGAFVRLLKALDFLASWFRVGSAQPNRRALRGRE